MLVNKGEWPLLAVSSPSRPTLVVVKAIEPDKFLRFIYILLDRQSACF